MIVLGERGYLGSVVKRRWTELGGGPYTVNCIRPDDRAFIGPGVIVPSTDAIDEDTDYAAEKRWIESVPGIIAIRAGIVDIRHTYPIAYQNWYCNPLTPLEWADLAWELRDTPGVHPAGRETLTRWEVARAVAEVFDRPYPAPAAAMFAKGRVMPVDRERPPLIEALREFREWLG